MLIKKAKEKKLNYLHAFSIFFGVDTFDRYITSRYGQYKIKRCLYFSIYRRDSLNNQSVNSIFHIYQKFHLTLR